MLPDDRAGDGKAKTDPARAGVTSTADPVEGLEHLLPLVPRDSRSFILNGDHDAPGLSGKRYVGLATIFDGIVHEVGDRPPHGRRPTEYRHITRSREGHFLAGVHGILADAFDQSAQIDKRSSLLLRIVACE